MKPEPAQFSATMVDATPPPRAPGDSKEEIGARPPALQATVFDPVTGTTGFVVADSLIGGRAMGGTRIAAGVSLKDVAQLAHRMSLKLALAGVAIGGAKGGIALDPSLDVAARCGALQNFGRQVGPLLRGGVYIGTDLGCSYEDRALIHTSAGYEVRDHTPSLPCTWRDLWRECRDVTGLGVGHACRVAADLLGWPEEPRRMVVQGFGEVGQAAARAAAERGFRVVAVADRFGTVFDPNGLPVHELCALTDPYGTIDVRRLPRGARHLVEDDAWLSIETEVLVLAAVPRAITAENQHLISATLVVEGANQPAEPKAIRALHARGVTVIPDIVANAGGAIGCGLALRNEIPPGFDARRAAAWLFGQTTQRISRNLDRILPLGACRERPLHDVALRLAGECLARFEDEARCGRSM